MSKEEDKALEASLKELTAHPFIKALDAEALKLADQMFQEIKKFVTDMSRKYSIPTDDLLNVDVDGMVIPEAYIKSALINASKEAFRKLSKIK